MNASVSSLIIAADRIEIRLSRTKVAAALEAEVANQRLISISFVLSIEAKLRRAGKGKRLVIENGAKAEVNAGLAAMITEAFAIQKQLLSVSDASIEAMTERLGMGKGHLTSLVRLSDLLWTSCARRRASTTISAARRREHAGRLIARNFDLVIVDEAHHLRERSSQSYKLVDELRKRFLLLLSATPVQNDLIELYNLLTLLKPGIFKTLKEFRAAYMTSGKPRQPANPERLRELMRGAMIRNTRAVVALKLPRRHAVTIRVDGQPGEPEAYAELAAAARQLAADDGSGGKRLALRHLLVAAGSSPPAAAAAVARFAGRRPDDLVWRALAGRWAAFGAGGKEMALLELLRRNPAEKKLVFVHARETLTHLADLLSKARMAFARFDGRLSGPEKDAAIAKFRDEVPVLLCTESGGEGRNIQFCNTLVNFDLPWNPMAIEQRIGRIDRIGQNREVFVFNLVTRGTIEEQVLALLDEKISMFELVVGEAGAILGGIEDDREFPELLLDAWLETTEAGRAEAFDLLGRRLEDARRQHECAKALDEALFGEDFETA